MAFTHETLCDGNHTDRQACNRALAAEAGSHPNAPPARAAAGSAAGATVIEAPPAAENAATRAGISAVPVEPGGDADEELSAVERRAEHGVMPAPSPWAVRAWEDTAAAVGATASPAPPPREPERDDNAGDQRGLGHVPLIFGLAGATALALLIARTRRK